MSSTQWCGPHKQRGTETSDRKEEFEEMIQEGESKTQEELEKLAELLDELEEREEPKTKTIIYNSYSG